ncbi:hypothetical protein TNIN_146321 [Trichonephila inaurata madagascariensis]|uniref:Uncharacterized protein n=1 Tax=Trichonephila inaurata madagascariensis TaxID=2747483 RepID=A0A8X6YGA6_9ARAC|nr:hypothetical protein TNIN_146321 [Trichonephila inaurata madagascariensis]
MNRSSSQLMGDLPPIRAQANSGHSSTSLDFAGPLTLNVLINELLYVVSLLEGLVRAKSSDNGSNLKGASESSEKARGIVSAREEIEACLNRPLTELSQIRPTSTRDSSHFLVGGPIHPVSSASQPSRSASSF